MFLSKPDAFIIATNDKEPDTEELQEAMNLLETEALDAHEDAIQQASQLSRDEMENNNNAHATEPDADASISEDIDIEDYIAYYQDFQQLPEDMQDEVARNILTGHKNKAENLFHHITVVSNDDRKVALRDVMFNIDIDSAHGSFTPDNEWIFSHVDCEIWPIGPFHRRMVGTSKFGIYLNRNSERV